ncbi:MAG TPA: bifunctional diguanylate cyclase/phosphodiesterase [Egibacteraceae bacterium]|nr:bifunctional diguanylate cyclase/phosphodiesterase [Egibacteraceae bacterium]
MAQSVLGERGTRWFLPSAALLTALIVALPENGLPRHVLHLVLAAACPVLLLAGVRLFRPRHSRVWYALGAGLALLFAGDLAWRVHALSAGGAPSFIPLADTLSLLGYVWVGVGGVMLLRCRQSGRDRDGLIDAAIFSLVAGLLIWHFVIAPDLRLDAADFGHATSTLLFPLGDVALFALMLRLVLLPGARVRSFWYLLAAMCVAFVCNLATAAFHDVPQVTAGAAGLVLLARAFAAAAALDPSMRSLTEPEPGGARQHHPARLLVLAGCLAVVPTLLGFQDMWGGASNRGLLMAAALTLTTLVLLRLGLVMADRDAAQRQLSHLALHDPLTGLPNRRLLLDRVEMALARSARRPGEVAVLFCDLDRFKVVNDSLGHAAGDELLIEVAARLRQAVRPDDTVARLGGDEFVICCEGLDGAQGLRAIAERVTRVLGAPVRVAGEEVFVTVSIGLASAQGGPGSAEALIQQADAAMYAAKAAGRDRIESADPEVVDVRSMRLERENALRRAIDKGGLRLEYQPVLDLRTGATAFVEALVRWGHPDGGLLQPDAFIPLAEESGLIVPLGEWVLDEALSQLARWHAAGRNLGCGMSVNVSARQLRDPSFVLHVQRALARTGVAPSALTLEITERVLLEEAREELASLEALRLLGVQIAVDDFGTRYASLAYLKRLPVNGLKIDRTFVSGVAHDTHDAAIVAAIVTLGHTLGMRVTAEGVETAEQLAAVQALGCDLAQGFYLGAAVPAAEAVAAREVAMSAVPATVSRLAVPVKGLA